jgi:hypothetical protein
VRDSTKAAFLQLLGKVKFNFSIFPNRIFTSHLKISIIVYKQLSIEKLTSPLFAGKNIALEIVKVTRHGWGGMHPGC